MKIKLLIADDHEIIRQGLRKLLAEEPDMEVVAEAEGGRQAVQLIRDLVPHVVIMDVTMPDLSGIEATREILAEAPGTRIVALSMHADKRFVINILCAGASAYLLKDSACEELAQAIRLVMADKTYLSPKVSELVSADYVEALRESEARFRTIFNAAPVGIALIDLDGRLVESNVALQRMLGYRRDALLTLSLAELIHPEEGLAWAQLFKALVAGERDYFQTENRYVRKDGGVIWGQLHLALLRGAERAPRFAIAMIEDITRQKQAEEEIRAYQERLRSLSSELSLTEERERRRLATDLHDHIGQILALAQIKLGVVREEVPAAEVVAALDEIRKLIEQSIHYTRSLTFELSPPILYDLGFEEAVEWLAEQIQAQYGIDVAVQKDRQPKPLSDEARVLLFRVVRELLTNVAKHAQARHASIAITKEGDDLKVQVRDDGIGFEVAKLESDLGKVTGFGLFSIRERLDHIGGRLEVRSEPGQGTQVTLAVPLKQKEKD